MGLDVSFYLQSKLDHRYKVEIGEFSKVYFLVNYFGFNDDNNGSMKEISNNEFKQFVEDLRDEIEYHKMYNNKVPRNYRLRNSEYVKPACLIINGYTKTNDPYDESYWNDVEWVYNWTKDLNIDWDKDSLKILAWW
jgi:hypothetical protein